MVRWSVMFLLFMAWSSNAWSWRCNGWIIAPGLTLFEVGQKCGDPQMADTRVEWRVLTRYEPRCETQWVPVQTVVPGTAEQRTVQEPRTVCVNVPVSFTVPVQVEEWYYDERAWGNVPKLLRFENGRLVFIETLWGDRHLP